MQSSFDSFTHTPLPGNTDTIKTIDKPIIIQ